MPSYDKPKLMKLLEGKHSFMLQQRDIGSRHQEARSDLRRIRANLERSAYEVGAHDHIGRLLALPLAEAIKLTKDEVTGYLRPGNSQRFNANVNFEEWKNSLAQLARVERLAGEVTAMEGNRQFAIVPQLLEAVQGWGFSDPMREM